MALDDLENPPSTATRQRGQMSEDELKSILAGEIYLALGSEGNNRLSHERRRLLEFYEGGLLGNEVSGRSTVISRNVYQAVEWATCGIVAPFVTTDKVCEFEPYRQGEESMAEAATEYVNYIMTSDNDFDSLLQTIVRDALIQKMGYLCCYWDEQQEYTHESFTGLTDLEYQAVLTGSATYLQDRYPQQDKIEVIKKTDYPNSDPMTAQMFPMLHDCSLRIFHKTGRVKIESIAPEEMMVSRRAPDSVLDNKHFLCRYTLKTVTELRQMGFDDELIEAAAGYQEHEYNLERVTRFFKDDDGTTLLDRPDPAMHEIWLEDSYLAVDYDGDGIAEFRRIISAGRGEVIFSNEEVDDNPFVSFTCIPMPHKHVGMSLAETVVDLQEISSTLWRQILDNLYISNMPRVIVDEMLAGDSTYDDLLNPAIGAPIRGNKEGITPLEIPFTAQAAVPILEVLDVIQEKRTGIVNQNMTLSPDDLNKYASGRAIDLAQQSGTQRVDLMARNIAIGVRQLAMKVLGLVIRHQDQAREIKISGQWLQFDPRMWHENMDVKVSVGLGTGNKDSLIAKLGQFLSIQQAILKEGMGTPFASLVTPEDVYSVLKRMSEASGFKQPFFSDPQMSQQGQQQQQPPNPEMMKAQAETQALQLKAQTEMELAKQKAALDGQLAQERHQLEMQRDQAKMQHQLQLEEMREQSKQRIEAQRLAQQGQLAAQKQAQATPQPPPVPGARQAPDGQHYVPDPNRPGKYMMVI